MEALYSKRLIAKTKQQTGDGELTSWSKDVSCGLHVFLIHIPRSPNVRHASSLATVAQWINAQSNPSMCLHVGNADANGIARQGDPVAFFTCGNINNRKSQFWTIMAQNCPGGTNPPKADTPQPSPKPPSETVASAPASATTLVTIYFPQTPAPSVPPKSQPAPSLPTFGPNVNIGDQAQAPAPPVTRRPKANSSGPILMANAQDYVVGDPVSIQNSRTMPISLVMGLSFIVGPIVAVGIVFGAVAGTKKIAELGRVEPDE